jgi:hypothetical protein
MMTSILHTDLKVTGYLLFFFLSVRKPVDHLVTTSARRTCRTQGRIRSVCLFIIYSHIIIYNRLQRISYF